MPKLTFRDFDDFADAIDGVAGRFVPLGRTQTDWWLESVRLIRACTQQLQIGGAATFAGDGSRDSIAFLLPLTRASRIRIDGVPLDDGSFVLVQKGRPFTFAGQGLTRWVGVTFPRDYSPLLKRQRRRDALPDQTRVRTDIARLEQLRHLILRVCAADLQSFDTIGVRRMAEDEIATVARLVLASSDSSSCKQVGRPRMARQQIVKRAVELIESSAGKPLFIDDLCGVCEVSERTLRRTFHEYFGVGPIRLLKVRQLREIQAMLLAADPRYDTVAAIAARFGVWDFSLFARNYRSLFGESPSTTLHCEPPRTKRSRPQYSTWLRYLSHALADPK